MIDPFVFAKLPQILFGPGKLTELKKVIVPFGSNILFITGGKSFHASKQYAGLIAPILKSNSAYLEPISGEPSPAMIDAITEAYTDKDINVVVAIGGGSVMDAGKAISAMLAVNGKITDYLEGVGHLNPNGKKIPFIAVPTTSGTGSETTKNAVISQIGKDGFKKSLRHDNYVPDVAIIDPELILSCPPNVTAASGMDAFTQLLEAYLSPTCDEMTSSLILSGLKAIKRSLVAVFTEGENLKARTDMAYAAMISGIALANAGLGTIHGFASPIGAYFDIPHGVVCGTLMAANNKFTVAGLRAENKQDALKKYLTVSNIFLDSNAPTDKKIDLFIEQLYAITEQLRIPTLGEFGITTNDIEKIVSGSGNKNNPVKFDAESMASILKERL
ncbi:iron-containing alcohol dehydrogenase [Saccharicrinis sp. FJH62]|uniref:iron-containing alcohol dehydrogenase n=1 Tax=Saccharicrinis sp. FJH62 TaxID=3344657 RepID=UPI0035D40871